MTSESRVETDRPAAYLKQLCRHFGHKVKAEWSDARGSVVFPIGTCTLAVEPGELVMSVRASEPDDLAFLEDIIARHLERFGRRDQLTVSWRRGG